MGSKKKQEAKSKEFVENQGRFSKLSPEERSAIAAKGGKARAEKVAAQKSLGQLAKSMLASKIKKQDIDMILDRIPDIDSDDLTVGALVVYGQILAAAEGNPRAFEQLLALEGAVEREDKQDDKLTAALKEASKQL